MLFRPASESTGSLATTKAGTPAAKEGTSVINRTSHFPPVFATEPNLLDE